MIRHEEISDAALHGMIRRAEIAWGGNRKLKIYGRLRCGSGQNMKRGNRVFFNSEAEARALGYRPCGHCLKAAYKIWKHGSL